MPLTTVTVPADLPTVLAVGEAPPFDPGAPPLAELDRQLEAYAALGVTDTLGLAEVWRAHLLDLRAAVAALPSPVREPATTGGDGAGSADGSGAGTVVPFLLVPPLPAGRVNDVVPAMRRRGRHGTSVIDPQEAATYASLPDATPPDGVPYVLTGIDTGAAFRGHRPEDALVAIRASGRTPLTMPEGVLLTAVRPDVLRPNHCFSLPGSRTPGNQRVPAVWISDRRAKLGWCWDRNPHTWLGVAHAASRHAPGVGAAAPLSAG